MTDALLSNLAHEEIVEAGVAPAAVVAVAARRGERFWSKVGAAGTLPARPADTETLFDLASVTKPFVALTCARLVQQGRLQYDTPLGDLVAECRNTEASARSLELLFSHRAGLKAHLPLFAPLEAGRPIVRSELLSQAARACELESGAALYSDMGYLLAGEALARAGGTELDELVFREVCVPLGLGARSARQWLKSDANFRSRVAPTETVPFRGGELRGVVHDENAWAFAGHGLAGQAGLFATGSDLLRLGMALLDALAGRDESWLSKSAMDQLVRERPGGSLRLGFDGKSGASPSAGVSASAHSFGHLGFTGTSLWCDPVAEIVTVLLTNRVCPTRANATIRAARPRVHEALFQLARG